MAYDRKDQLEILLQLIIGDGDSNRTNRGFILNPSLTQFGVYSGAHTLNGHQSCLVYAETYFDNVDDSTVT
jgi:hypothetical protein